MTNKSERVNALSLVSDFDVKRIVFSEHTVGKIPGAIPITYKRIPISVLNKDGTIGDLILPTERLFSYGVSENLNPQTKKVDGHVLPLCLWTREGATPEEKEWTNTFEKIVEHCKEYVVKNKEEIEQYDLTMNDLKKFNPLYWKREKGKIVEGTGPTLYAKLISRKEKPKKGSTEEESTEESAGKAKILSMFFSPNGESIEPLTLLGKYCYVRAAVKIESIYIGNKISLQVKLYEAVCEPLGGGMKSVLARPTNTGLVIAHKPERKSEAKSEAPTKSEGKPKAKPSSPPVVEEDAGSLHNSDVEVDDAGTEEKEAPPASPVKPVRKVVKKVTKK
jgi:hypothetical protein